MAQQPLHGQQIDARFKQVGGVAVPQGVHRHALGQAGGPHGAAADLLGGRNAQGVVAVCAGEQPSAWAVAAPVVTQLVQESFGERDETVLAPLGVAEVEQAPRSVKVFDLQADDLGDTQAAGVGEAEQQAVPLTGQRFEETPDLVETEDDREGAGLLAVGEVGNEVGAAEGDGVEETQSRSGLVEEAPGNLLLQEMELEGAELLGGELIGGSAEVLGEADHSGEVGLDGPGRVVAQLQIVQEALPQGSHENILVREKQGDRDKDARPRVLAQIESRAVLEEIGFQGGMATEKAN